MNATTTRGPAARTRQSDRVKGICRAAPLNKGETIQIDLTEGDATIDSNRMAATRGAVLRGGASKVPSSSGAQVQNHKGKRVVTTVEKGIEIMESKRKRKKPDWKH